MLVASINKLSKNLLFPNNKSIRYYSNQNAPNYLYEMKKAYFRRFRGDDRIQINFHYNNPALKVKRNFNFSRCIEETVETCLARVKTNVEKQFFKNIKKKNLTKENKEACANFRSCPNSVQLLVNNVKVNDKTFVDLLGAGTSCDGMVLIILEDEYEVLFNQPWVNTLQLPSHVMAGYNLYPSKIEIELGTLEFSKGAWYKGIVKMNNWQKIHEGFIYKTCFADVGFYLKFTLTPSNGVVNGPTAEVITDKKVNAGPGKCPFEYRLDFTKLNTNGYQFRVVTYNILANLYADSDFSRTTLFSYCPSYALDMEYRKQLLTKEIIGYNADILCLQEVDLKVYEHDLKPLLHCRNYDGFIEQKGYCGEGVVTFYRKDRFELVNNYGINIGSGAKTSAAFSYLYEKINDNQQLLSRFTNRGTTLQVTVLYTKDTKDFLIVANTHLYYHPDSDNIRLFQCAFTMMFIEEIYRSVMKQFHLTSQNLSIVYCGDFNSTPDCGIYKLMTEKYVDENFKDWRSNSEELAENVSVHQPFNMKSACGCPTYTNYTKDFAACLDYIFYQTDNLEVAQVVPMPSHEVLKANIAIPSVVFPSDHVALVAVLRWKKKTSSITSLLEEFKLIKT